LWGLLVSFGPSVWQNYSGHNVEYSKHDAV